MLDEKNPLFRNTRDGPMMNLDVNNDVYTMDMLICFHETSPFFQLTATVSGQIAFDKSVRSAVLYKQERVNKKKKERNEETELNEMSDGEGDEIDGVDESAATDWRMRAGSRNKPTQREREEHEATHVSFRD